MGELLPNRVGRYIRLSAFFRDFIAGITDERTLGAVLKITFELE
jgi:hypothetical protein